MHKTASGRWQPDAPPKRKPLTKTQQRELDWLARQAHSFDAYQAHQYTHITTQHGCCFCDPDSCVFKEQHAQAVQAGHPWDIMRAVRLTNGA